MNHHLPAGRPLWIRMSAWAVALPLVVVPASGANQPTQETSTGTAEVMQVLLREADGANIDRRQLLAPENDETNPPPEQHWAAGHVRFGTAWLPYEHVPACATKDALLADYLLQRDQFELSPQRHLELADWCRDHGMADRERAHLANLLDQFPRRDDLVKRLGWQQVDGAWISAGSAQELEVARKQQEADLRRWKHRAQALASRLTSPQEGTRLAAHRELDAINDPAAIPAFELALGTASEAGQIALAQFLRRISRIPSTLALTRLALDSESEHVRQLACDALRTRPWEHYVPLILEELSTPIDSDVAVTPSVRAGQWTVYQQRFRRETHSQRIEGRYELTARIAAVPQSTERQLQVRGALTDRQLRMLQTQRTREDLGRFQATLTEDAARTQSEANAMIAARNQRYADVLTLTTGTTSPANSRGWWTWWASYRGVSEPPKGLVEVSETNTLGTVRLADRSSFRPPTSCLPAGTTIWTELGSRAVDTLKPGDRVLAQRISTGELAYRAVLFTTRRSPQPLTKLTFDHGTIEATRGHYFWVSGIGWRMARELEPGQQLHTPTGTATLRDVGSGRFAEVFNLVVDEANTYFVGDDLVLSHDVTTPVPTDLKVPGLAVH